MKSRRITQGIRQWRLLQWASLWFGLVGGSAVLAPSCASSDPPEGSSSSHWVRCRVDPDCASYDNATCSDDGYCTDEAGQRISHGDSDAGSPNGDDDDAEDTAPSDDTSSDDDVSDDLSDDLSDDTAPDDDVSDDLSDDLSDDPAPDDDVSDDLSDDTAPGDDVSSDTPELVDCQPLARWQRTVEPADPLVVARDDDGSTYAVTELGSDYVVWRSRDNALQPLHVVGSSSGSGQVSLTVQDEGEGFSLLVGEAPAQATLFLGEQEQGELDPAQGEALEVLAESALAGFDVAPIDVAVGVEAYLAGFAGEEQFEILVLRPDWAYDSSDFRVFYGAEPRLSEVTVESVVEEGAADGATLIEFRLPSGETETLTYGAGAATLASDPSTLLAGLSSTDIDLARLSFQCLEPVNRRFEATGAPFEPPAAPCEVPMIPMGACIAANLLSQGTSVDVIGTVAAVGTGLPPEETVQNEGLEVPTCPFEDRVRLGDITAWDTETELIEDLHWFRIEYDGPAAFPGSQPGDSLWLVLRIPDLDFVLNEGDVVHLSHASEWAEHGVSVYSIELRDEVDDLLFWLGYSYNLDGLIKPAELTLEMGAQICLSSHTCSSEYYAHHAVQAALDGSVGTAPHGEAIDLGPYRFTNSALEMTTGLWNCSAGGSVARMALWRR